MEVRDLRFQYPRSKKPALNGVTLSVKKGEMVGIIGPSGSGKSTLVLTFNGIIPHSIRGEFSGEVLVRNPSTGEELSTLETPVSKLSTAVGLVLQNPESQLFNMTVEDEVAFALENLGLPRDEIEERVSWALGVVGLEGKREEFPPNLSGGEKQRLAIASVLAMRPPIIVMDEPTSQLDPEGKREVENVILRLKKEGVTVVIVEHDSRFLFRNADRIIVLKNGSVFLEGTPREVARKIEGLLELGIKLPFSLILSHRLGLPPLFSPREFQPRAGRRH
nr:ATP-binding cassette domain-containing protein [Thermococcus stetteri]